MLRRTPSLAAPRQATLVLAVLPFLAGCPDDPDPPPPDAGGPPGWDVVFEGNELDRAVLSVWGANPNDVFVVGGPIGNSGFEALAMRYDGSAWTDLKPGGSDGFWWVSGLAGNDVWMSGETGRIVHYDGSQFVDHTFATTATMWGIFPLPSGDVYAVGGTPGGGTDEPNDLIAHYNGSTWSPVTLPGDALGVSLYKVWGTGDDNLYVVGEKGTIWHKTSSGWQQEDSGTTGTLFTVHGCSETEIYAVGGFDVLRSTGDGTWAKQDIDLGNSVSGIGCAAAGAAVIAGFGGLKQRHVDGTWIDEFIEEPHGDLHAVWAAGGGEFWAVGGDFNSGTVPNFPREGLVARYGVGTAGDQILP